MDCTLKETENKISQTFSMIGTDKLVDYVNFLDDFYSFKLDVDGAIIIHRINLLTFNQQVKKVVNGQDFDVFGKSFSFDFHASDDYFFRRLLDEIKEHVIDVKKEYLVGLKEQDVFSYSVAEPFLLISAFNRFCLDNSTEKAYINERIIKCIEDVIDCRLNDIGEFGLNVYFDNADESRSSMVAGRNRMLGYELIRRFGGGHDGWLGSSLKPFQNDEDHMFNKDHSWMFESEYYSSAKDIFIAACARHSKNEMECIRAIDTLGLLNEYARNRVSGVYNVEPSAFLKDIDKYCKKVACYSIKNHKIITNGVVAVTVNSSGEMLKVIQLGGKETIEFDGQEYEANLQGLQMLELVQYGNPDFHIKGDFNFESSGSGLEVRKIRKLNP